MSPALAYLLCRAKRNVDITRFDGRFVFHEPQEFKGVVNGRKYPVISIITSRDIKFDELEELEASLLDHPREAEVDKLFKYLEVYIEHHGIERPELKLTFQSTEVPPPDHYTRYIEEWREDLKKIKAAKILEESSATETGQDNATASDSGSEVSLDDLKNAAKMLLRLATISRQDERPRSAKDDEQESETGA